MREAVRVAARVAVRVEARVAVVLRLALLLLESVLVRIRWLVLAGSRRYSRSPPTWLFCCAAPSCASSAC